MVLVRSTLTIQINESAGGHKACEASEPLMSASAVSERRSRSVGSGRLQSLLVALW